MIKVATTEQLRGINEDVPGSATGDGPLSEQTVSYAQDDTWHILCEQQDRPRVSLHVVRCQLLLKLEGSYAPFIVNRYDVPQERWDELPTLDQWEDS